MQQQLETPRGEMQHCVLIIHILWCMHLYNNIHYLMCGWSCGVMVSTLDFESKDPSSSLGRTCFLIIFINYYKNTVTVQFLGIPLFISFFDHCNHRFSFLLLLGAERETF